MNKPRDIFFLIDAPGTEEKPQDHHQKICSGIEDRTSYDIHLDAGGPNREDPSQIDPPSLLVTVDGRRWKIPVPDIAKEIIQLSWSTAVTKIRV